MIAPARLTFNQEVFIAAVDERAALLGLPTYSEIAHALPRHVAAHEASERNASDLFGSLRAVQTFADRLRALLSQTTLDQPRATVELALEEAVELAAAAYAAASQPRYVAEMRTDLDGRDDVTVLADARTRLRISGRRL